MKTNYLEYGARKVDKLVSTLENRILDKVISGEHNIYINNFKEKSIV